MLIEMFTVIVQTEQGIPADEGLHINHYNGMGRYAFLGRKKTLLFVMELNSPHLVC